MINQSAEDAKNQNLGSVIQDSMLTQKAERIIAAGQSMPLIDRARTYALESLQLAGFGDVPLPTDEEKAALDDSGVSTYVFETEPASPLLLDMARGFAGAVWIVGHRLQQRVVQGNLSAEQIMQEFNITLAHAEAIGNAWEAAEQVFHTPENIAVLQALYPDAQPQKPTEIPADQKLISVMVNAMKSARRVPLADFDMPLSGQDEEHAEKREIVVNVVSNPELAEQILVYMNMDLGALLRSIRVNELDLTQSEIVGKYFSVSYLSAVERGQISPSVGSLKILAKRLRVDVMSELKQHILNPRHIALAMRILAMTKEEEEEMEAKAQRTRRPRK